jgi:dimethylargininase
MLTALTRKISKSLEICELTHVDRNPINITRAAAQHRHYEDLISSLGVIIVSLPGEPEMPDAPFVEDVAIIIDGLALITPMGSESRKAERDSVREILGRFRKVQEMDLQSRLEGGDILRVGRSLFAGLSSRTDSQGIDELRRLAEPLDYQVTPVPVTKCLHLKTGCTYLGNDTILINPLWIEKNLFKGFRFIEVHPSEPAAANALLIKERVIMSSSFPRTVDRVELAGFRVEKVAISELEKAEAGLTCMSVLFDL